MKNKFKLNPKIKGSGIIECIPQTSKCPMNCKDCFFQSGRSYLEPLNKNLPHIPSKEKAKNKIVRFNDGNDSNNERMLVEKTAEQFKDCFFNTAIPNKLREFFRPVVLTVNPGDMTDDNFFKLKEIPNNLMFVRVRVNSWNINSVVIPVINYYTNKNVVVVLTFMAYYTRELIKNFNDYIWHKRTTNDYWCLNSEKQEEIENIFKENPYVYSCGYKYTYKCKFCGNCLREYFNTKERINNE